VDRGLDVDVIAPQVSFFFNAHIDLLEEIAKFRAARRLWASIMADRFHAKAPESLAPGEYRLVGWIAEVNDMAAGPGQTMKPWVSTVRGCATDVRIPETASRVEVTVHYDASGSCDIDVALIDQPD